MTRASALAFGLWFAAGCSTTPEDRVRSALDVVADMSAAAYERVRVGCVALEWAVVARTGTDLDTDEREIERIRARCDRIYRLFEAWIAADRLAREAIETGQIQEAIKLLPEIREYSHALREALGGL